MTSSPHGPYARGCTRATMGRTKRCNAARPSQSQKPVLSSDCGLQPARMKLESLVIADQHCRGEWVPEPCTHRPSSHQSGGHPKSPTPSPAGAEGETRDGD